ncbi:MAG TPA: hypothetical protein VKN99_04830 [Polyangia bacterium]|nr:hypothetical protein [Polyangia bacterium]
MSEQDHPPAPELPGLAEAWPAAEPPAEFVDRVMAAFRASEQPGARSSASRRRRNGLVAAGAIIALAAAVFLVVRAQPAVSGRILAVERESIRLGSRGVAVAEPDAELGWDIARSGRAQITQPRGNVFYRVEPGGPFVVSTPAGEILAKGTCFRVEVEPMQAIKQTLVGAGVGAAIAATVVVTVYEGRVHVRNAHGQTDLSAGERGTATTDQAPGAPKLAPALLEAPPPNATRDDLLARDQVLRNQIAALLKDLADARQVVRRTSQVGPEGPREKGARMKFSNFSPNELKDMAKNCTVRFDLPDFGLEPQQMDPKQADKLGLAPDQRAAFNRVLAEQNADFMKQLRALYLELTGDTQGAQNLDARTLEAEIEAKSPRGEPGLARQQLAQEKAGLAAPPADPRALSVYMRYLRLITSAGDAFERALADAIGADRARQLHEAQPSPWGSKWSMSGCPGRD